MTLPSNAPSAATPGTSSPWTAERSLSQDQVRALLARQFPELVPLTLEQLGVGWDNTAYLVNGTYVVRFPRRTVAVPLLEKECRLLAAIGARVSVPVPLPVLFGEPGEEFPWPFVGYRMLAGRTACRARLDDDARARLARPLGEFLSELHGIGADEAFALGADPDQHFCVSFAAHANETIERLVVARRRGLPIDYALHLARAEAARGLVAEGDRCLVHGDLYARHVLVSESGALAGVIDWGDVHAGHPGIDLAIAHAFLPPSARTSFFEAYSHPVSENTSAVSQFRALMSSVALVAYGSDIGDRPLVDEGLRGLRYLADS